MLLAGFGNHHQTEAITGALPPSQNSPQQCPLGLYAEQLSGSAFTRPRHANLFSWLYRTLPSVVPAEFVASRLTMVTPVMEATPPNPLRWSPLTPSQKKRSFLEGLFHIASTPLTHAYLYQCNESMTHAYFCNRDGELLFVPYQGALTLQTEMGLIDLAPGSIAVIPRGLYFKVVVKSELASGYLCENAGLPLALPQHGPIGPNSLANPRHFIYPEAAFESGEGPVQLVTKFRQHLWVAKSDHSPLNVVAWHGNYAPYSYDLALFNPLGTVSFDHPDPSLFTVLTSESEIPGVANLDFVIFPPRWMVALHTFRPPYFHRNIMSELMGLITGQYDAKQQGFAVGGVSLHNSMSGHGPDASTYQQAISQSLKPEYYENTLAFMFETREPWLVSEKAYAHQTRQRDYLGCWAGFEMSDALA